MNEDIMKLNDEDIMKLDNEDIVGRKFSSVTFRGHYNY